MEACQRDLIMKFKDFISFTLPTEELIRGASHTRGHDTLAPFPIGVEPKISYETLVAIPKATNELLCYCNVKERCHKGTKRRRVALQNVYGKSFITFEGKSDPKTRHEKCPGSLTNNAYFAGLAKHKFAISPSGNGLDTHRTYEALICKTIPIVQYSKEIMEKYQGLPILATKKDYKDITAECLEKKYEEMLEAEFNFSRLLKSYWTGKYPELETNSRYWLHKFRK